MPRGVYERTPEFAEKCRQRMLGRPSCRLGHKESPETREKMRQAHLGRPMSPETRERMHQAMIKRWADPEAGEKLRQALRQANLGRHHSPEVRERIRQAQLGKINSPEAREKMSQAHQKGGWIDRNGYHVAMRRGQVYLAHRVVWEEANGSIPKGHVVHHINGVSGDNRLENLQMMPRPEHMALHRRLTLAQ